MNNTIKIGLIAVLVFSLFMVGCKKDIIIDDIPKHNTIECPKVDILVIAYTDEGKYFCDGVGMDANCIMDNTIEMPFG